MARTLRSWLEERPFAVALSAGYFGFFAHAGFVAALEESGLRPARVSGSSGGALVAALWAAGLDAGALRAQFFALERRHFWDPWPGLGLLRGRKLEEHLRRQVGGARLEEARWPVAISTHDVLARRPRVLVAGDLARAVHASVAVPFLFHPVRLDGRWLVDGGISDRSALADLERGTRVLLHHVPPRRASRRSLGATCPEERAELRCVAIGDLPGVGPFALDRGPAAFERARDETHRRLAGPPT